MGLEPVPEGGPVVARPWCSRKESGSEAHPLTLCALVSLYVSRCPGTGCGIWNTVM